MYDVIDNPPSEVGGVNETETLFVSVIFVVVPIVGVPGVVTFTALEAEDMVEPIAFVAFTVNVYETLFKRPETIIGLPVPVAERPAGEEAIVYEVIEAPPSEAGGVNEIDALFWSVNKVATTLVAFPGAVVAADAIVNSSRKKSEVIIVDIFFILFFVIFIYL
jgi:hypothetical protein